MDFLEVIEQTREVLKHRGRVTYRTLKRQFGLDDEALEDLKEELIDAERVASDEDGRILVWIGDGDRGEAAKGRTGESATPPPPPSTYTPVHLAGNCTEGGGEIVAAALE